MNPRRQGTAAALAAAFIVSGACGLVYESVWAHYLKLFLGHAAYAQTVVLVVFIGGMAAGAALCGRLAERIVHPLRAYAMVEFAIGLGGVAFHGVFVRVVDWAYATLLPAACGPEGSCVASWVLAAALVLPQSVLLGTTFPLMVSGVTRAKGTDAGRQVSLLYFLNSIGAVAGVLAATFVIIPAVGLPGTLLTAGIANVAIAIVVWEAGGRIPRSTAATRGPGSATDPFGAPSAIRLLLAVSALTGLSSFLYEIFWIRMLSLVLGASTHAFELMLASFILGLALGGWWIRSRIDAIADAWRFLGRVQLLMGLAAAATLPLYNVSFDAMAAVLRSLARSDAGYVLYNAFSAGIAMAVMLPATFLAGMTLPLITLLLLRTRLGERSIGFVYAANTVGAIAGVLLAVHVLMPLIGLRAGMLAAAGVDILLGIVLFLHGSTRRAWSRVDRAAIVASLAGVVAVAATTTFDPLRLASGVFRDGRARLSDEYKLLFHQDGKTATVDVLQVGDSMVLIRTNGKTDAAAIVPPRAGKTTADEETMTLAGALSLAYRPDAADVAVIGFGSGMSTATLLESPRVQRVETIEIEPAMIEGAKAFRPLVDAAFTDPRSRLIVDDAKAHFARAGRKYDVILSEPSNPWVSGVSSLFTAEFYARVRGQLRDDGLLVQWVQVYEFNTRLLSSILQPLGDVFGDYVAYRTRADDLIIVAVAKGRLGEPSARIFADRGLAARLEALGIGSLADIETRRVSGRYPLERYLVDLPVPPNSDYFPIVDLEAPRARFIGASAGEVFALVDGPMPLVEMLDRRPLRFDAPVREFRGGNVRQERAAAARKWASYLTAAEAGDGKPSSGEDPLAESVAVVRTLFVDCASGESVQRLWDRVVLVAGELNPLLPRNEAGVLWERLAASPCAARWPADKQAWMALFAAVGARDATRMSALAEPLLDEAGLSLVQRNYLFNAAMTGYLVDRRHADARATWARMEKSLPAILLQQPWMRLQWTWAQAPF
ncbi:MAG: fused MFS/spermidine synthase [Betaproteobacteria bacterium]|nr:fused MFS/spermidine synthase [Betaproteobacteria bacterium]